MGASGSGAANHGSGGQWNLKSSARGVTCAHSLLTADHTRLQVLRQTWSNMTGSDGSSACVWPARVCRTVGCPWHERYWTNQLGDHGAETSPTMWHPEPYGFEIIGKEWKGKKKNPYIDALRTVHLVGCDSFTVSACLTDNMAKGIHLKHSETTNKARSESTQEKTREMTRQHERTRVYLSSSISLETSRSNQTIRNLRILLVEIKHFIYMIYIVLHDM